MEDMVSGSNNPLATDLDHILSHTGGLWEELRGRRIFITGGTGFFGCWLLESFAWANEKLDLGAKAVVLTRNPKAFAQRAPHLASHASIGLHTGDVRSFSIPDGPFSHVIHAATPSDKQNHDYPFVIGETVVEGTRRTLDFAVRCGARKLLLTSTGAVYGRQPAEMTHMDEDYEGVPSAKDPDGPYGLAKRKAESLCHRYAEQHGIEAKIGRGFSFVGPYLPLDIHYAVGNFIRDATRGGPVRIQGDGKPRRSYLYAADLVIWLWTILFRGSPCRPYNVGSEEELTIEELARQVVAALPSPLGIQTAARSSSGETSRYVPSTRRAREELGLKQYTALPEAIRRTVKWCSAMSNRMHYELHPEGVRPCKT